MSVYLENFSDEESMLSTFGAPPDALKNAKVLIAWYGYGSYCGSAFVLFKRGGKLYEVNASHCSCNGIESCWDPELTSVEALEKREFYGEYDGAEKATEALAKVIQKLKRAKR